MKAQGDEVHRENRRPPERPPTIPCYIGAFEAMVNKSLEKRGGKSTKQPAKRVKEVACKEPKPLQAKSSVKEAGEKIRSFHTDRLPVASGWDCEGQNTLSGRPLALAMIPRRRLFAK